MMAEINEMTTAALSKERTNNHTKIIDIRPVNAYNGWRLKNENRGGHIAGARSLPYKWTNYMDWIEVVRSKQILPENKIIIYGYDDAEAEQVAGMFAKAGYNDVSVYSRFLSEWVPDESLPMDKLERYQHLVPAEWVKDVLEGKSVQHPPQEKVVVCHAHYRNRDAYLTGHIPGAIDIDTLALESEVTWNRRSPEELKTAFEKHGITADSTVILYGKFMYPDNDQPFPGSAAGHLGAIRSAFIMMYAGVKDVRVMNGGFQSWKDAGFDIETNDVQKNPVTEFGAKIPSRPYLAVDVPEAKEILASQNAALVSIRSWPEYIGEVSGYNYIEKKGRIPGSVFGNCGTDAYHMENYRNVDHTTREFNEIAEIWKEVGVTPDKRLAFYCGTGWRGSEAFYNAWLMGWPEVAVYDGGWFEWSNDDSNPFETGIPEKVKMYEKGNEEILKDL